MVKKMVGTLCLLPLVALAAPATISDWRFEPNGDVRVVVDGEALYVSPSHSEAYFNTLMAARLQWPVEVKNGELTVDAANIPAGEQSLLTTCTTTTCSFENVERQTYACLLDKMETLIQNPPPPATNPGTITPPWPDPAQDTGVVSFTMPPFVGPFTINVAFNEPAKVLTGVMVAKPTKPVEIPNSVIWGYVDSALTACRGSM